MPSSFTSPSLSFLPSLSRVCSISSVASATHILNTFIFGRLFDRIQKYSEDMLSTGIIILLFICMRDRMRQRLCISASAAHSMLELVEAKRIHAEEMKSSSRFSHRWTSEVKPCIDLCAAAAAAAIISKTKSFFFLLYHHTLLCSETKSFDLKSACFFSV